MGEDENGNQIEVMSPLNNAIIQQTKEKGQGSLTHD
jgi:hypothetical protein